MSYRVPLVVRLPMFSGSSPAFAKAGSDSALNDSRACKHKTRIDAGKEDMKVSVVSDYQVRFLNADCGKATQRKWQDITETLHTGK